MATKRQLVVFKIGVEEFAVDIGLTKEIVVMREITPVPQTLEFVEGVMNLRGNLVPVLDLRKRLRAGNVTAHSSMRIIIANLDGKQTGLIVDGASDVVRASQEMIEPPPDVITELGADYIEGVINLNDRFITLLDLSRALAVEWAAKGIRVNSVSPGYTLTAMTRRNAPEVNAGFAAQTPLGRLAEVEEVAEPVVFLLGERAGIVIKARRQPAAATSRSPPDCRRS